MQTKLFWINMKKAKIMKSDCDTGCRKCTGEIRRLEGLPAECVFVSNEYLEVGNKLCYLGDYYCRWWC